MATNDTSGGACPAYYGLWHPSKREQSNRAWVLLILATPADSAVAKAGKLGRRIEWANGTARSATRTGVRLRGHTAMSTLRRLPNAIPR